MEKTLDIILAGPDETGAVLDILNDAIRWLESRGLPTWNPDTLPPVIAASVARNEVYLARLDGVPVATVTIQWSDPTFWGERPDDAGYIHKLAVARIAAGRDVGTRLLAWAEAYIAQQGRSYARLDCHTTNPGINRIYQQAGYELRGTVTIRALPFNLYEKQLTAD